MRISDWSSDVCSSDLHAGDLRDAERGQIGLVVENAAEVLLVRKHFVLHRQERATGVDQIQTRQTILARDFLCAQMLLDRDRVVTAALDGGVVADDHALSTLHAARKSTRLNSSH